MDGACGLSHWQHSDENKRAISHRLRRVFTGGMRMCICVFWVFAIGCPQSLQTGLDCVSVWSRQAGVRGTVSPWVLLSMQACLQVLASRRGIINLLQQKTQCEPESNRAPHVRAHCFFAESIALLNRFLFLRCVLFSVTELCTAVVTAVLWYFYVVFFASVRR